MKHRRLFASAPSALALAFLGTGALSAAAQGGGGPPVMAELPLRSIGPAVMSGRVSDLAVVPGARPWEFYVGTASGGLFRTRNNGATWDPLFDHFGTTSIGAVALSPSDPATVWVGTGEPANRQSSSFGDGVYVSFDGGDSFRHRGLETSEHIGRIVVDPDRPLRAFVAALGPLWRSGGERGVFRTDDGGENWEQVLEISADTGVVDLEMDPRNPAILYAAAYTRRRTPWGFSGGGPEGGIFRSRDGGDSWERLGGGLPEGPVGRIGLEIAASDPPQRVRARRTRNRVRSVAVPRPGGDLGADLRPEPAPHVLLAHRSGSGRHPPGLCARVAIPCLGRRGAHFPGEPGHDAHL